MGPGQQPLRAQICAGDRHRRQRGVPALVWPGRQLRSGRGITHRGRPAQRHPRVSCAVLWLAWCVVPVLQLLLLAVNSGLLLRLLPLGRHPKHCRCRAWKCMIGETCQPTRQAIIMNYMGLAWCVHVGACAWRRACMHACMCVKQLRLRGILPESMHTHGGRAMHAVNA